MQKVWRLQRAAGKGVQVDRQGTGRSTRRQPDTRSATRTKDSLEGLVGLGGRIDCTVWNSRRDANAADLSVDSADEDRCIRSIGRAEVGNLRRDNVVEDAAARVDRDLIRQLVGRRSARLPTQQWSARERACARWSEWPGSKAD